MSSIIYTYLLINYVLTTRPPIYQESPPGVGGVGLAKFNPKSPNYQSKHTHTLYVRIYPQINIHPI